MSCESLAYWLGDTVEYEEGQVSISSTLKLILKAHEAIEVAVHGHVEVRRHLLEQHRYGLVQFEFLQLALAVLTVLNMLIELSLVDALELGLVLL